MDIRILGSTPCIHDPGDDAPCFLLNEEVLVDCGWNAIGTLRALGHDPKKIKAVVFTHMHHDHYMGLPGVLFHYLQTDPEHLENLTVAGPKEDLERVVSYAMTFLQAEKFYPGKKGPCLLPLAPGDAFETETFSVRVGESRHPVPALAFRFTDKADGAVLGIAGDTVVHPGSVPFFTGDSVSGEDTPCDLLIHDSACGYVCNDPIETRRYGHSSLLEAAALAETCNIPVLLPMHMTFANTEAGASRFRAEHPDSPVEIRPVRLGDRIALAHKVR